MFKRPLVARSWVSDFTAVTSSSRDSYVLFKGFSRTFASSNPRSGQKTPEAKKADTRSRAILRKKNDGAMSIADAVSVLKAVEISAPRAAYELTVLTHFTKGSAAPRGRVSLPHNPASEDDRILVFADGKHMEAAKKLGVTYVGGEELVDSVLSEKIQPTKVVCTPSLLPKIAKLARFLGPKGLMPAVRRGTVTEDISGIIKTISGALEWKADKEGIARIPIGRLHNSAEELEKNISTFLTHIRHATAAKEVLSKKTSNLPAVLHVYLSSTRGPGIPLLL